MKKIFLFLIVFCIVFLCGCSKSQREVDDYAYVIAIGIDKGGKDNLKVTLSFANPNKIGSGKEGGAGEGGSENLINFTTETSGIYNALNVANDNISKVVNLSHVKLIVFSKEIAKEGLQKYVDGFVRELHVRPVTILAVCDKDPDGYLRKISPKLEVNPEKYINDLFEKQQTTFISKTTLRDFYSWADSDAKDLALPYIGTLGEEKSEDYKEGEKSMSYNIDDNETSQTPKKTDNKSVILGSAFFKGDKMVGTGSNIENLYRLILEGNAKEVAYSIKDNGNNLTELSITQRSKPKIKVDVSSKRPKATIDITIEADIMSIEDRDVDKNEYLKIEQKLNADLEKNIKKYLNKTVKDLKVDPVGFGNKAKMNFLTFDKWKKYNFKEKYPSMEYSVNVNSEVIRFGLLNKSLQKTNK